MSEDEVRSLTNDEIMSLMQVVADELVARIEKHTLLNKICGEVNSSHKMTQKEAVLLVLRHAGDNGMTKEEIARHILDAELVKTSTTFENFVRSLYQGVLLPMTGKEIARTSAGRYVMLD